ncbi:Fic/DOC family N-terminal domain-containing protein [Alpinimonas psychrophila]|uniref:Fic family protein n=1 Tax=Alpinimonas psychrophila TaxID=748908 RepID=A0A7W3JTE7_9MICO|nr:Fic family protein [Alpinimonas psychrophila]
MDVKKFGNSPIGHLVPISGTDGRFGTPYQDSAYVAHPLAAEPQLEPATWRMVNSANRALARLDQASLTILVPSLFRRSTLRREAQSTSALEGIFAPFEQVLAAEVADNQLSKELLEVMNYVEAADAAFQFVGERGAITVGLVESVHSILVRGTDSETRDAGRIRSTLVAIGSPTGAVTDARFVPMPSGIELNIAVQDLVRWIGSSSTDREPLVAAAMTHYQFETLHPFNDGNGRIGRLLIVLQFMVDGLLHEPLLSVSPWFEARRTQYQDELAAVSATGKWDSWIQFFAAGIESSADDIARRIDRLLSVQQRYVQIVQDASGRGVIRDIVDVLIGDPFVSVPKLAKRFDRTSSAVTSVVTKLVELNILSGPFGTYNRQYMARDVWIALTAPVGAVPSAQARLHFEGRE